MEISEIKVFKFKSDGKIKAKISCTIDGWLSLSGFKVCSGPEGLFIGMPSEKVTKDGEDKYYGTVFITDKVKYDKLREVLMNAYNNQGDANEKSNKPQGNFKFK